jgi:hypothetical protein
MKNVVVLLMIFLVATSACRESSNSTKTADEQAMSALKSSQSLRQSNFSLRFWNDQRKDNTPLWQQGLGWCNEPDHRNLQNCHQLRGLVSNAFMPPPIEEPTESFGLLPPGKKPQH